MATLFVTGGNGFVGSHLIDALAGEGHTVRALVRDPANLRWLPRDKVEMIPGDLFDRDALTRGAQGADAIFHIAALLRARSEREMFRANLDGTRNVLDACLSSETPPALLLLSSQAAGGPSPSGRPTTEEDEPGPLSSYGRSKLAAERLLEENAARLPVRIVRAPAVYGPRDDAFLALFRYATRGLVPRPGGGGRLSIIHVADLAQAMCLIAIRGDGTYYVTDGELHEPNAILHAIGDAVGRRIRIVAVPSPIFIGAVWFWEWFARLAGGRSPMSSERAREAFASEWICSDGRARRELGYESRWSLSDGMKQTVEWYGCEGWIQD